MKSESCKGVTLVEVLVAMVILGLVVTGLNLVIMNMINTNVAAKEVSAATAAGNQLLDQLRQKEYSQIVSGSDVVENRFLRTWTVTNSNSMKSVTLRVLWPLTSGNKSVEMSTIVSRPGLW